MVDIPRQLSVDQMHSDPDLYMIGLNIEIALDGEKQSGVIEYNIDEGWLVRYVEPFQVVNEEAVTEKVTGNVTVKMKDAICHI